MSYVALYRKWRPDSFDAVKGQDAIVRTLRNQIIYDRIGHAYLFCGTRGTGKTSIAKLFARAVNCQNPKDGNPCGSCPSCRAIREQTSLDVREIDAASNNGVDYVRELREEVRYSPVMGRYRVYIIDEVHMLSTGAFNALLKTLEEPPSYVIFILATTEKHKVPVTILSRCQQYDFKRISTDTITAHLVNLMKKEGIEAEEKALRYIARAADGSMRDALSLLDQCISFYLGQALTYDHVLTVLGTVDTSVFSGLLRHILVQDTSAVLSMIDEAVTEGRDLGQFLSDFLWYLRNILILKDQHGTEDSIDLSQETIDLLKEEAQMIDNARLLRFIQVLSDLSDQLKDATQKRILLEVGFLRLTLPQMDTDTGALLDRLRILEEKMSEGLLISRQAAQALAAGAQTPSGSADGGTGNASGAGGPGSGRAGSGKQPLIREDMEALSEQFPPAEAEDLKKIAAGWKKILAAAGQPMITYLKAVRPVVSQDSKLIQLMFEHDDISKQYFERDHQKNLQMLSDIVARETGKQVRFECVTRSQAASTKTPYIDLSRIHMDVIFE